tara:strand:- start:2258 stop:2608 length:351 start_codon:yes stop_codon:yes gene_type:complete
MMPHGWQQQESDPCVDDYNLKDELKENPTIETIGKYPEVKYCFSETINKLLIDHELHIRAKVVNEPRENVEAYNNFTEAQVTSLDQIKEQFTAKKQELETENASLEKQIQEQQKKK